MTLGKRFTGKLTGPEDGQQYLARHAHGEGPATFQTRAAAELCARAMVRHGWRVDVRLVRVRVEVLVP